ncbi:S8 family peptidase [Paenibacillus sp. FSL H7-0331]|uniref:S8 family peptidase n=1 Tax=Paenibacillus sp. FSL H7-0331 TaxID=1920421 RepID=UPI00096FAEC7|nr:S8 family peptidase [Paenibacillus sp. FSL H7-0331]OMF18338.1 peptidase S8 [Paenibacillus sp. FSL H7-0331]
MWKYALAFVMVLAFGVLLFPRSEDPLKFETLSAAAEMQSKKNIMQQDLQVTGELCRSQCSLELDRMLHLKEKETAEAKLTGMQQLQAEHPHMEKLIWTQHSQPLEAGLHSGSLNESIQNQAQAELLKAKTDTEQGKSYQSAPFQANGSTYFVLGVPSENSGEALLGVVKQSILQQVENHQLNNLRIVTYPSDNRYKIESVDSRTLQDVKVNHPEQNEGTSHYHVNQVVVRFKTQPSAADLAQIETDIQASKPYRKLGYTYIFESKQLEAKQLMNYFQKWNIAYVEPHFLYMTNSAVTKNPSGSPQPAASDYTLLTPNDSLYQRYQWNLPAIDTELGWAISKGSKDVPVAIVDTGVDLDHPDLKDQLISGYNVVNSEMSPMDDVGHGTHVAGVIGAIVNNRLGVAGMSWYNPIIPVKVLDQSGAGSTYAVAQGIIWATDHGAKVINMSLGNYADANFLHDAIRYAYDHDVVLIAASGNDNTEQPGFPAAYPEVFAVAATDANRNKASFSNYGDYIDVAAPGVNIASTYPHNQYAALSGTSMASPHVTALAALIRSVNPSLTNKEVMQIMRDTASDAGPAGKDKYFGYGIIDVVAAVKSAVNHKGALATEKTAPAEPSAHTGVISGLDYWSSWAQRLLERMQTP